MRTSIRLLIVLSVTGVACSGSGADRSRRDTPQSQQQPDSPATASGTPSAPREPGPSGAATPSGKEPGTIPATPTPTVTSESSITAMRAHLQRLDTASAQNLQAKMKDHAKALGDLLTTMGVEVQAVTAATKNAWVALSDSVDGDLDKLALAEGEELRTAFREHRNRVLRLLDQFRLLVPARADTR